MHVGLAAIAVMAIGCGKSDKQPAPAAEPTPPAALASQPNDAASIAVSGADERVLMPLPADFKAALRKGRALEQNRDYAGARVAFQSALASAPGDARALSELSWIELKLDHHEAARKAAAQSVANTANPKLQAASLYNLGRAEQALGHRDAAIVAYQRSLTLRPDKTVARQLEALTGHPARPLAFTPLDGPFKTLEEACKLMPDAECHRVRHERLDSASPWLHVALFSLPGQSYPPDDTNDMPCNLAVRTTLGWFVSMGMFDCDPAGDGHAAVEKSRFVDQQQGAPLLSLQHSIVNSSNSMDEVSDSLFVCGIGKAGAPSCTRSIPMGGSVSEYDPYSDEPDPAREEWTATAVIGADGMLTIAGDSPLEGAHKLVF